MGLMIYPSSILINCKGVWHPDGTELRYMAAVRSTYDATGHFFRCLSNASLHHQILEKPS